MNDKPGEHPEPPADLADCKPLILRLEPGAVIYRIYDAAGDALNFGQRAANRFDAPDGSYGVLYAAADEHACFAETCFAGAGSPSVTGAFLRSRRIVALNVVRALAPVDLAESGGLARIRADARLVSGSHALAQRWSAALRSLPSRPDGLCYPARHDPARRAFAIYDHARGALRVENRGSLMDPANSQLLAQMLDTYQVSLVDG